MKWLQRTIVIAAAALVGLSASSAFAQGGGPANLQYTPQPQLSPYLYLFPGTGPGSAYASQLYVRPNLEQSAFNNQAASSLNYLQQQLSQVRGSSGFGTTGTPEHLRPTGHASSFMDYGHYYTFGARH